MSKTKEVEGRVSFDAKKLYIGELISSSQKMPYVVPAFQRSYSWSEEQVNQLVQDLLDFYELQRCEDSEEVASEYSLGTIVCERQNSRFSILDGQQRITTLDLLLDYIARKRKTLQMSRHRLIASYQYLTGYESSENSNLPPHEMQEETIAEVLNKHFENVSEENIPWAEIESCFREKVYIMRVTLPLAGGKIKGEAAKMFEIINVSGQKLSLLDQIKARLLSVFSESQKIERAVVSCFWDALPELLRDPEKASKGFDFRRVTELSEDESLKEERFADILDGASYKEFLDSKKKIRLEEEEREKSFGKNEGDSWPEILEPPIDVGNLLVVANELLRYSLRKDFVSRKESVSRLIDDARSLRLNYKHFNWFISGSNQDSVQMSSSEKVLRFVGTANLILQIVGRWGVYRQRGKNRSNICYIGKLTAMNTLQISFMAENRFHGVGQYWFLMLSANVLARLIPEGVGGRPLNTHSNLIMSFQKYWSLPKRRFNAVRPKVFERLVAWAIHRARSSEVSSSVALKFGFMDDLRFYRKFQNDVLSLRSDVRGWTYRAGLRHWQLYLLDWLLLNDGNGTENFPHFRATISNSSVKNMKVLRALNKFREVDLSKIRNEFRIVRRGAIEHWYPQEMAKENKDLLSKINGFGNLALIDTSLNSSLRDLPVVRKKEKIMNSHAKVSLKLGWLAVFTAAYPKYDGDDVEALTDFWGDYMSSYPFEALVKNP